ncbi:hypothetical protein HNQ60_005454 [Povalibacter uvarum]|uniref:Uncharacterized protein n=1 Tax=Povalibacter uvarum TaxID=732238 RepID=A0A841HX49_9GAMM|nr:hypothetical protein [Povalibacter uvarum]MBB6096532.1 hypothetical protein [Povalibacter uvarum]
MNKHLIWLAGLIAVPAMSGTDPVAECRARHSGDSAAHIACLEGALQGPKPSAAKQPQKVQQQNAPVAEAKPTELGAEQVRAGKRDSDEARPQVLVDIVSVSYGAGGLGTFRMADGQVWRETVATPERARLDSNKKYSARIERGAIGGYRMYVDGERRMIKLERIE